MIDAIVGAVIMVVATSSLVYAIEVSVRAFDQAGQYNLNSSEKQLLENYFTQLVENPETSKENPYVDLALLIYNLDETTQKS